MRVCVRFHECMHGAELLLEWMYIGYGVSLSALLNPDCAVGMYLKMSAVSQTTEQTCLLDVLPFEGTNMVSQCCIFEDGAESLGGVSMRLLSCKGRVESCWSG